MNNPQYVLLSKTFDRISNLWGYIRRNKNLSWGEHANCLKIKVQEIYEKRYTYDDMTSDLRWVNQLSHRFDVPELVYLMVLDLLSWCYFTNTKWFCVLEFSYPLMVFTDIEDMVSQDVKSGNYALFAPVVAQEVINSMCEDIFPDCGVGLDIIIKEEFIAEDHKSTCNAGVIQLRSN